MSPEERQLLSDLFDRVRGAAGSPRDREAEDLIAQKLREQPYAAYFLAQAVIIQDQALQNTTSRMQELEDQVQQLESQVNERHSESTGFLGGLGSLFGSKSQQPAPRGYDSGSQRDYAQRDGRLYDDYRQSNREPEPSPGPWGRAGAAGGPWAQQPSAFGSSGGFLSGALTTAAGVAGGVLAADAIRGMFSSHVGGNANPGNGLFGGNGNTPVEENTTNNYFLANDKSDSKSDAKPDPGASGDSAQGSGNDNDNDDTNDSYDTADYDDGGSDDSFA